MIKTMLAKYRGICAISGAPIYPYDQIKYDTVTRKAWLTEHDDCNVNPEATVDNGKYIADTIRIGRNTYYRNKKGRCIDAPCCGCCTI